MEKKIAVITGGSHGIGLETPKELSKTCIVYELSRKGESHDGITHVFADVSDENCVSAAIDSVVEKEGKIDILVCCAGRKLFRNGKCGPRRVAAYAKERQRKNYMRKFRSRRNSNPVSDVLFGI